jgi:hypothetical protein
VGEEPLVLLQWAIEHLPSYNFHCGPTQTSGAQGVGGVRGMNTGLLLPHEQRYWVPAALEELSQSP